MCNITLADDLVVQGAKSWNSMVLAESSQNIQLSALEEF